MARETTRQKAKNSVIPLMKEGQEFNPPPSHSSYPFQIAADGFDSKITHSRKMVFLSELYTILFMFQATESRTFAILSEIIQSVLSAPTRLFLDKAFSRSFHEFFHPLESSRLMDILKKCHAFLVSAPSCTPEEQEKKCRIDRFLMNLYLIYIKSQK